jgi:hypothetical protein
MWSKLLPLQVVGLVFLEVSLAYSFYAIFLRFQLPYRAWKVGWVSESMAFLEMGFKAVLPDCWTAWSAKRTYGRHIRTGTLLC